MPASTGRRLLKILLFSAAAAVLLCASAGPVTYRLAGGDGVLAMAAALLISLLSNLGGAVPACWLLGRQTPDARSVLGGMLIRVLLLVILAGPLAWSALLPQEPLLLWLAGSYFVMLMIETALVASWMNARFAVGT